MEIRHDASELDFSIPYKRFFLLTLFTSVITIDLFNINIAIGDILLFFLNVLLLLFFNSDTLLDKHRKKWLQRVLVFFSVILFLSYISIQSYIFTGHSVNRGVIELIKLTVAMNYGVVFGVYFTYAGKEDLQMFLRVILLSGVLVAVTGILGSFLYTLGIDNSFVMNGQRAKGTLSDTNIMAIFLVTLTPLIFLYYHRMKSFLIFMVFAIAVLATSSKAAVVVSSFLILVYLMMLFLTKKHAQLFKTFILLTVFLAFLYMTVSNLPVFSLLTERLSELTSGDPSVVTTGRTDLWMMALSVLRNPVYIFLGIGYGAFANQVVNVDFPFYLHGIDLVHNTYLSMLVETGVLTFLIMTGLSLYLLIKTFFIALISRENKWLFIFMSQLSLIIGLNQVNLQNNRFVYILFIYFFFITDKKKRTAELLD